MIWLFIEFFSISRIFAWFSSSFNLAIISFLFELLSFNLLLISFFSCSSKRARLSCFLTSSSSSWILFSHERTLESATDFSIAVLLIISSFCFSSSATFLISSLFSCSSEIVCFSCSSFCFAYSLNLMFRLSFSCSRLFAFASSSCFLCSRSFNFARISLFSLSFSVDLLFKFSNCFIDWFNLLLISFFSCWSVLTYFSCSSFSFPSSVAICFNWSFSCSRSKIFFFNLIFSSSDSNSELSLLITSNLSLPLFNSESLIDLATIFSTSSRMSEGMSFK